MNKKYNKEQIEELNHPDYMFKCVCCGISKPNSEFHKNNGDRRVRLFSATCKDCKKNKKDSYKWARENPEKRKAVQLKYNRNNVELLKKRAIAWKIKSPFKSMLGTYRQNAAKRGFVLEINSDDLEKQWLKQKGLCYYTNEPMLKHYGSKNSVSIDRVDSSKGYTLDNVVLCLRQVNIMKNDATLLELFQFCESILNNKQQILNNLNNINE